MAATSDIDFSTYLQAVTRAYGQWWTSYTLTDAVGQTKDTRAPFDFDLRVQTVAPQDTLSERAEALSERAPELFRDKPEKTERLPVLEGLRKYAPDHGVLIGRPGSGKSTALIRLLLETAKARLEQGTGQIPVLVELRYWQTSITTRILAFLHKHDPQLALDEAALATRLRHGDFLLLFDGLNELPSEAARQDVARFETDFPQVSMVFTTRDLSLGGGLRLEKKLEMQPLTEAQMRQFVCNYLGQYRGKQLLRQLKDRLRELGQTPLLLAMLCSIFSSEQVLPTNLGEVFRQFTQFYEQRLKGDIPDPHEYRDDWSKLLQCLAFAMMQGPNPQHRPTELTIAIPRSEAEQVLAEFLQDRDPYPAKAAERCLKDLLKHHLIQPNGEKIEFRHQLLQEYYAAEALLPQLEEFSDEALQCHYLNHLKWTEAIALMLALIEKEEQALRVARLALAVDLKLGARLAGEVKLEFQEQVMQRLTEQLSNLEYKPFRSLEIFEITGSARAALVVIEFLQDPDYGVRTAAAQALGQLGHEAAIPVLTQALQDSTYGMYSAAAQALGQLGHEAAILALVRAFQDSDLDSECRSAAAEALGRTGNEAAIPALMQALQDPYADCDGVFYAGYNGVFFDYDMFFTVAEY